MQEGQRRQLANTPIHPVLLDLVTGFLAKPAYRNSLPVMAVDSHDVTLVNSPTLLFMVNRLINVKKLQLTKLCSNIVLGCDSEC